MSYPSTCADAECWEAASCNRHRFMVTHELEWTSDNPSPFCLGLPEVTMSSTILNFLNERRKSDHPFDN
jgi:hypothetical protein